MSTTTEPNPIKPWVLLLVITVATLIGVGLYLGLTKKFLSTSEDTLPAALKQHYLIGDKPIVGIKMTDQWGQPFTEARFKQHWTFMFFGYTQCPDVCPTTLLLMKQVWEKLPVAAKQSPTPQMVFVSVDPDRDTQEKLKDYVSYYHPDFIGVRSNHDNLDVLTNQLGVLYGYEDGSSPKDYTVLHSAQLVLIDPNGSMRAVFSPPLTVPDIVSTFSKIRDYFKG
ncbi:MAG: SCO family protein [Gammaproteobacteria bacterium]|nr:SCO family protein [Gammaproteobacteria bacterium]